MKKRTAATPLPERPPPPTPCLAILTGVRETGPDRIERFPIELIVWNVFAGRALVSAPSSPRVSVVALSELRFS